MGRARRFFVREDGGFDRLVAAHRARGIGQTLFYLVMHLVPGFLAYVGIF